MLRKSLSQISHRTLDYLARKHPWFDAILRNRYIALFLFAIYIVMIFYFGWKIYNSTNEGWNEIIKSYSPLFFDLFIIFLVSSVFLLARGYFIEENSRIDPNQIPDPDLFISLNPSIVKLEIEDNNIFERHGAISAILEALPIEQSDYFLAHAGSLDIPKLTLKSIYYKNNDSLVLKIGVASFKEFFFTHHFADYPLSRTSSRDSGKVETLRELFSPIYVRQYKSFFKGGVDSLETLSFTPNTLGVTGCVQIKSKNNNLIFFQWRGYHESAARGYLHLSYAGTISAYPDFAINSPKLKFEFLADEEFQDEFMSAEPGKILKKNITEFSVSHKLIGLCMNSQYLFQPELFTLTTIYVSDDNIINSMLEHFSPEKKRQFIAVKSIDDIKKYTSSNELKIRPLCEAAINNIYKQHFLV